MTLPNKESNGTQKEQVKQMFDDIALKYDFLNHFLTVGIDKVWRRKVCKIVKQGNHKTILDVASGTGDLAIALSQLDTELIKGIDISPKMLALARKKVKDRGLSEVIKFVRGDAEDIKEENGSFQVVTCAFGVRNFENINNGLSEIYRVLGDNGRFVILELSLPRNRAIRKLYRTYFNHILPRWGKFISKDIFAYSYLPKSVEEFPEQEEIIATLKEIGFRECFVKTMHLGIATIYVAQK